METPNTRSRRKRELELIGSQEETSTVVWGQDDELLREFMAESSGELGGADAWGPTDTCCRQGNPPSITDTEASPAPSDVKHGVRTPP